MKTKLMLSILALFLFSILLVNSASAYIVDQHYAINREAFEKASGSPIMQEIKGYENYFQACSELTDITVASYFDIDEDANDAWYNKLIKAVSFKMGKPYRATHDPTACINNLPEAKNIKEKACGYGICAHQVQDTVPHNLIVPAFVRSTKLSNGLIHSIVEIKIKNQIATKADWANSRNVLDYGYEMSPYLERVFGTNPALQDVDIPQLIDLFITQVKPDAEYQLGFRSFFALPTYIYWFIFLMFFVALGLLGLTVRKVLDRQYNAVTFFSLGFSLTVFAFFSAVIYGLLNKNIWSMWEGLSQFLFSPAMYFIGGAFIFFGVFILYRFIRSKEKMENLGAIFVAIFLIAVGLWMLTLPTALDLNMTQQKEYHNMAVQNTVNLLNKGVIEVKNVPDPTGFTALQEADKAGATARFMVGLGLVGLLAGIVYYTFRPRKKSAKGSII